LSIDVRESRLFSRVAVEQEGTSEVENIRLRTRNSKMVKLCEMGQESLSQNLVAACRGEA
jgi:hypothetical protein